MDIIQNIAESIDILRISKGLTVNELCLDICDESSYRRYKTGKRDIPITRIKLFCDRLGIGFDEFLYNVTAKNSYQYKLIYKLFYALQNKNYTEIKKLMLQIDENEIALDNNKILFQYILSTYKYETNTITNSEYFSLLANLSPSHEGFYTFNDIIILDKLAWLEMNNKVSNALDKLNLILLDTKKLYAINNHHAVIATIYANVANLLTKKDDFKAALIICEQGINYSKKYNVTKNIHHLYYLKAYLFFQEGHKDAAMLNLSIVISLVFAMQDKKEFKYFIDLISNEFQMTKSMIYQMHQVSLEKYL